MAAFPRKLAGFSNNHGNAGTMRPSLAITFAFALTFLAGAAPSHAARSHETGCLPPFLKLTLERLEDKIGDVEIVSTHRPGARVAGTRRVSKHADCRAIDFNPPPGKSKEALAWLKKNHDGGLGTYSCGMHHIHIDSGEDRHWHTCVGGKKHYAKVKSGVRYAKAHQRKSTRTAQASKAKASRIAQASKRSRTAKASQRTRTAEASVKSKRSRQARYGKDGTRG